MLQTQDFETRTFGNAGANHANSILVEIELDTTRLGNEVVDALDLVAAQIDVIELFEFAEAARNASQLIATHVDLF